MNQAGRIALGEICAIALNRPIRRLGFGEIEIDLPEGMERIITAAKQRVCFCVRAKNFGCCALSRCLADLSYEGVPSSLEGSGAATMPLLMDVAEIPGESQVGMLRSVHGEDRTST